MRYAKEIQEIQQTDPELFLVITKELIKSEVHGSISFAKGVLSAIDTGKKAGVKWDDAIEMIKESIEETIEEFTINNNLDK